MTVLDRVAKTKGALASEKVQVPQRASRFGSPLRLALLRLPRRLMTAGFTIKKKGGGGGGGHLSFPGKADGERFGAKQSLSTSGVFSLPRQVIRCAHLADNEATVGPIVSALHGLLNGPPNPPRPRQPPRLQYSSAPTVQPGRTAIGRRGNSSEKRPRSYRRGGKGER